MTTSLWPVEVKLAEVDRKEQHLLLTADEAVRARVIKWLHLASLSDLKAEVTLTRWLDGAVLRGKWSAVAEQICGVTLEPLPVSLKDSFEIRLLPPDSPNAPVTDAETVFDPDAPDPPDVLETETVQVGDYVLEQLALSLDPFPRKEGAVFTPPDEGKITPFAALAALKVKRDGDAG